jgi:hypothetical protein
MFDVIERLKSQWTDKYVVISRPAPELARFSNATGVVRTVNMNGRCLVEFDQFNNIGWYDIDPSFLRIVPEPLPKPAAAKPVVAKPAAVKPAPAAKAAPAKPPAGQAAAAPRPAAKASGRPSTADILAMARGKKAAADAGATPIGSSPPAAVEPPPAPDSAMGAAEPDQPVRAEAPAEPAAKPAVKPQTLATTAEKIAWCRSHDGKG